MGIIFQKVMIFLALIFYLISFSLAIGSLLSDYWVISKVSKDNHIVHDGGVHSGLLNGIREIDWGLGIRHIRFSVMKEIQDGISFYNRILWIFILFFVGLGVLWICVGVLTLFLLLFNIHEESIVGPVGVYVWSLLALLFLTVSCVLFYIQYHISMQNLLTIEQVQVGFSTKGLARLGSSFYLMLGALLALYFPPLFIFSSTGRKNLRNEVSNDFKDPTALLY
ncbi:hypothetical protein Angca_001469 [Angiostrongylus cantonensis]|nr:hypothetical protein Angca_001469 [Angiostrongylus cantonensis]